MQALCFVFSPSEKWFAQRHTYRGTEHEVSGVDGVCHPPTLWCTEMPMAMGLSG